MTKYIDLEVLKRKLDAWKITPNYVYKALDETPIEDVKPVVHSHWVHHKGEYHEYVSCARCGELAKCTEMADCYIWKYSKYCCGCGSTMDGEIEEVEE